MTDSSPATAAPYRLVIYYDGPSFGKGVWVPESADEVRRGLMLPAMPGDTVTIRLVQEAKPR